MEINLTQQLLTQSDCYKAGRTLVPRGIMVHSVGVAQPNPQIFIRKWNRPGVNACVHAFVSDGQVIQTLPWTCRAWHAGGAANNTHLSMECCEPAGHTYQGGTMIGYDVEKNRPFFEKMYRNTVALCAQLCRQFKLDPLEPGVLICHAEGHQLGIASNHADVLHWWPKHGITMERFRQDVWQEMEEEEDMTQEQFNTMMNTYLEQRGANGPASWSQQARAWAEAQGIVAGDAGGGMRYPAFATREEIIQMLYRVFGAKSEE